MKRVLFILALLFGLFNSREHGYAADVISQWAPVIYQKDNGQNPFARENVFTIVNFDRDWRSNNNSVNLPYYAPYTAIYYSLVESDKYYYIGYYLYYPRHGGNHPHEHDMIGFLSVVRKTFDGSGCLDMLLTYSHKQWRKWDNGEVQRENGHPVLAVSEGTHEIQVPKSGERIPAAARVHPLVSKAHGDALDSLSYSVYRLVDLNELWQRRNDIGKGHTFLRWGYFDSYYNIGPTAPWLWEYKQISWLTKPAELVQLIRGIPATPEKYLFNPYL